MCTTSKAKAYNEWTKTTKSHFRRYKARKYYEIVNNYIPMYIYYFMLVNIK